MRHFKHLLASLIIAPTLAIAAPNFMPLIHNGEIVTSDQQFPFVVAIYHAENSAAHCTGSVIADKWVLTAAHCVMHYMPDEPNYIYDPKDMFVGTGHLAYYKEKANKVIAVKNVYVHNNVIDRTMTRDVALLELKESAGVESIALPESPEQFANLKSENRPAIAVGYGWINLKWSSACEMYPDDTEQCHLEDATYDGYLHYGNLVIQSDDTTIAAIDKFIRLFPLSDEDKIMMQYNAATMIGAFSPKGTVATNGDSGGPLFIVEKNSDGTDKYVQIGVASKGLPLPVPYRAYKMMDKSIDIYANLSEPVTFDFIRSTMHAYPKGS